jgi:hypothetical protein
VSVLVTPDVPMSEAGPDRQREGIWARILAALQACADAAGKIGWTVSVDSTIVRAHQQAGGARRHGHAQKAGCRRRCNRQDQQEYGVRPIPIRALAGEAIRQRSARARSADGRTALPPPAKQVTCDLLAVAHDEADHLSVKF